MIKIVQGTANVPANAGSIMMPTGVLSERLGGRSIVYSDELLEQSFVYLKVDGEKIPCGINVDPCGGIGYIWEFSDFQGKEEAIYLWEQFLEELDDNL